MAQYRKLTAISRGRFEDGHGEFESPIDVSIGAQVIYPSGPSVLLTVGNSYGLVEIQVPIDLAKAMADDLVNCANSAIRTKSLPLRAPSGVN